MTLTLKKRIGFIGFGRVVGMAFRKIKNLNIEIKLYVIFQKKKLNMQKKIYIKCLLLQ